MMEEQLREARLVAEKAQTELDRFIYSASHDIRSPISSIQGLINIMKIEFQDIHSTHLIDLMAVSISRLERFVLGLTTFAQNSKREVRVTEIDFERMVGVILNRLVDLPSFYKISVSSEIVEGASFFADRFRLRVALSAVIKNSFDFSDLRKANPFVSIKITTHAENAVIEILDNGVGIASTHQARVFEMFYRGSDLSTGSGIGLYTARDAVVRLGGNISLNSEYGIGTSVRIVIPNTIKGRLSVKKKSMKSSPSNESTRVA
jgi:signal transduction histidine kinase